MKLLILDFDGTLADTVPHVINCIMKCIKKFNLKELEYDEVKASIEEKIKELKKELASLDKEKVVNLAIEKKEVIKEKAEELYNLAVEKGTPILQKAAEEVRDKTAELLDATAKKIEKTSKKIKKA